MKVQFQIFFFNSTITTFIWLFFKPFKKLYFSSDYQLKEQINLQNFNDLEKYINEYLNSSNITNLFNIFIFSIIGLNIMNLIELFLFYDYISLPYSVNLVHKIKNLNRDNGNITILDKFDFKPL